MNFVHFFVILFSMTTAFSESEVVHKSDWSSESCDQFIKFKLVWIKSLSSNNKGMLYMDIFHIFNHMTMTNITYSLMFTWLPFQSVLSLCTSPEKTQPVFISLTLFMRTSLHGLLCKPLWPSWRDWWDGALRIDWNEPL